MCVRRQRTKTSTQAGNNKAAERILLVFPNPVSAGLLLISRRSVPLFIAAPTSEEGTRTGWLPSNRRKTKGRQTQILPEWSAAKPLFRGEAKRNEAVCGCSSPAERRERACGDEGEEAKKLPALFRGWQLFWLTSELRNGGRRLFQPTTDWSSRAEQSERPEGDL